MPTLPDTHREVKLATRPRGLPRLGDFAVVESPLPTPGEGEVLVRNRFFHVFASMRMLIAGVTEGTPFPAVVPGDTLAGAAIGEVVCAPPGAKMRPGKLVAHWLGWREYAAVPVAACTPLGDELPDPVAHLGQGWTAYAALTKAVQVRPGDTVFVSAGGSAIGSIAGQVARLLGAGRVIGSTGSREKADRLVSELGYDAAVVRGEGPLVEQLAKAAPDGIDVFFDNVGGEQLPAAVEVARDGARFVLVGALAGQLAADGPGTSAPATIDSFPLILKQIVLRGFSSDRVDGRAEWLEQFGSWLRSGDIVFPHVRVPGIENAPRTLLDVIDGRHLGVTVIEL
ncbi:MAG TPA: NADP-dependent oxidoreductase [Rugosimonospora sp.]|nr:NADP-dependent oxidoreductase [Rugosimonospora sp.]